MSTSQPIDQRVKREFPYPIARAWSVCLDESHAAMCRKRCYDLLEVLARFLVAVALADYLRGPVDDEVEEGLSKYLHRSGLGGRLALLGSLTRALGARPTPAPFIPELCAWEKAVNGTGGLTDFIQLIPARNQATHYSQPTSRELEREASNAELDDVRALLEGLGWLRGYRLLRVCDDWESDRGGREGDIQLFVGDRDRQKKRREGWEAPLRRDQLYLATPDGAGFLDLHPLLVCSPVARDDRVFLLDCRRGSKGQTLRVREDGSAKVLDLTATQLGEDGFVTWLSQRAQREPFLVNRRPDLGFGPKAEARPVAEACLELGELLGEGSMAQIYRAWATIRRRRREVAVKVVSPDLWRHQQYRERFHRECAILEELRHPAIIPIHDVRELEDGRIAILMELLEGGSLASRLRQGEADPGFARALAGPLLHALATVHDRGVLHRDIKPSNILLDGEGRPYLADFGVAHQDDGAQLTRSTERLGNRAYAAPEVLRGRDHTRESDVYSLALTLTALCTGEDPPNEPGRGVDGPFGDLLRAMGAAEPGERLQAGAAHHRLLGAPQEERPPAGQPLPPPETGFLRMLQRRFLADGDVAYQHPACFGVVEGWLEERAHAGRGGFLLLVGAAGSGKSRLVFELARKQGPALVAISATRLAELQLGGSTWERILEIVREELGQTRALGAMEGLQDGSVALVIDALDEAFGGDAAEAARPWGALLDLLRAVQADPADHRRIVVTCRTSFTGEYLEELRRQAQLPGNGAAHLDTLSFAQVKSIWRACEVDDPDLDKLREAIRGFPGLCESPRVLLGLAALVKRRQRLAETRFEVLQSVVEGFVAAAHDRGVTHRIVDLGADLLVASQQGATLQSSVDSAREEVRAILRQEGLRLDHLIQSSLFLPTEWGSVETANRSIAEYLVAQWLVRNAGQQQALHRARFLREQPPHEEVVRLFGEALKSAGRGRRDRATAALRDVLEGLPRGEEPGYLASWLVSLLSAMGPEALSRRLPDLQDRSLPRACFFDADLGGCDFGGADLSNSVFSGCRLRDTSLAGATLKMVYLASPAELRDVDVIEHGGRCRLAWARADGTVRLLDAAADATDAALASAPHVVLRGHRQKVNQVRWLEFGRLLSASNDGTVRLWEHFEGDLWAPRILCQAPGSVESLHIHRGHWVASGHCGWLACGTGAVDEWAELPGASPQADMRFGSAFCGDLSVLGTHWNGEIEELGYDPDALEVWACKRHRIAPVPEAHKWCCADLDPEGQELLALAGFAGVWVARRGVETIFRSVPGVQRPRVRTARFGPGRVLGWAEYDPVELCFQQLTNGGEPEGPLIRVSAGMDEGWVWSLRPWGPGRWLAATTSGELLIVRPGADEPVVHLPVTRELEWDIVGMDITGQQGLTPQRVASLVAMGALDRG